MPESNRSWTYIRLPWNGSFKICDGAAHHDHLDIRPTIEYFFGLVPLACAGCGTSFITAAGFDSPKQPAAATVARQR